MQWKPDKVRPIKPQICEQICLNIVSGEFKPNEKIPSVRDMAIMFGVNPNTVQGSLDMLEGKGILYSVRGSGWFVSENTCLAENTLKKMLKEKTDAYFNEMTELGLTREQIGEYITQYLNNEGNDIIE